ncbi:MAG: hypothetical protein JW995_14230 [Melioribacteraceae bacterium]|nr:hypothetical protein [Melioribacteraceae bacterium]
MITIVSGLRFSGKELMMKALKASGMNVVPNYLPRQNTVNHIQFSESESMRLCLKDPLWLKNADNSLIKLISFLIPQLPFEYSYNVIFMENKNRFLFEPDPVYNSLQDRLTPEDAIKKTFLDEHISRVKGWMSNHSNFQFTTVNYLSLLESPFKVLKFISTEFGIELNMTKGCNVLYGNNFKRNKYLQIG